MHNSCSSKGIPSAIDTDLAACVPTIATWSLSTVPKFLPAEQIQHVLDCCDRDTAIGKRNYAILLLLARLGLRAGEVVALTLEDIDWEAGLITVRSKRKRMAQMPLPVEVGAAMADFYARPDRIVPVAVCSSGARRRWSVSPIPSQSARWWTGHCKERESSQSIEAPTYSVTAWPPRC